MTTLNGYFRLTPHGSAHWPAARRVTVHAKKFVASLSQILPIMPVLPIQPTRKCCAVYNLPEDSFHGMEEVIGSIPIRSTGDRLPLIYALRDTAKPIGGSSH